MNYTPERKGGTIRALYLGLLALGLISVVVSGNFASSRRIAFICISMVSLVGGVYLMMRYELTTYTYILNAKENDFDFFVNKATGKRGNYVCYYLISDVACFIPYEKETKDELVKKYQHLSFYTYTNNPSCKTNVIVFKNAGYFDAVIIESNEAYDEYLKNAIALVKEKKKEAEVEEENDDE